MFMSESLHSCPDVQNPSPTNPYILQMNGNVIKKSQMINQLSAHKGKKVAARFFSKRFVSPVRTSLRQQKTDQLNKLLFTQPLD